MKLEILSKKTSKAEADGNAILFLHGSYTSAAIWAGHFMPFFRNKGFDCYAMSLRGHGASEGALTWASLSDYIDDLAQVAGDFAKPPILVGHSMGGLIVQHYICSHPARAAVLLATVPPSGLGSSAIHMSMAAPDVLWQLGLLQSLGPEAVAPGVMARALFSHEVSSDKMSTVLPLLQRESHRVAAELLAPAQPTPPQGANAPPILVLGGDADLFLPVSAFRETATYFRAELEILNGAPHGLMLDDEWWETAAKRIVAWFERKQLMP
jgi:pimeloyl-ACP methyl ester carboxylesterase